MGWSSFFMSRVFSFLHALNVSLVAIYILSTRSSEVLWNPGVIADEMWGNMFLTSVKYFTVDLFLMLIWPTPGDKQYIIHHIFGNAGIFFTWYFNRCWLIGLIFELTELSSVFLNITWYLHKEMEEKTKNNLPPSPVHKLLFLQAGLCLLVSFFLTRIVGGGIIFYYIYDNYDKLRLILNWFTYSYLFIGVTVISSLNVYWFYKLILKLFSQF